MKVAVYGTLKKGGRLHGYVSGLEYLGEIVLKGFTLYDSQYGYPWAVKAPSEVVYAEMYEVPDSVVNQLDYVELSVGYVKNYQKDVLFYEMPLDKVVNKICPDTHIGNSFNVKS